MLRPFGKLSVRHLFWLPLALCLWPLVARNYRQRARGELPDEWYWADRWLFDHGFTIDI